MSFTTLLLHFLVLTTLGLADNLRCWVDHDGLNAEDCKAAINLIPVIGLNPDVAAQGVLDHTDTNETPRLTIEFPEGAKTLSQRALFHHGSCFVIVRNVNPVVRLSQDSRAFHFWPAVQRRAQNVWNACVRVQGQEGWDWGTVPRRQGPGADMRYSVKLAKGTETDLRFYKATGYDVFPPFLGPGY